MLHFRDEPKSSVPSPAHLVRRQFQKVKPNLGRAHGKKEEPDIGRDRADQSEARKPENNLLQPRDSDTHLQKVSLKKILFYHWVLFCQDLKKKIFKNTNFVFCTVNFIKIK